MKIMVPVKRVIDPDVQILVKRDGSGVATEGAKYALNPFDENALEEAIRLKEGGNASEVVAVSVGDSDAAEILRTALALGADRALLVETDQKEIEPLAAAKALKAVADKEGSDLIILGKQAIDRDRNQTGQMLAGLLGWPQALFASEVTVTDERNLRVTREIDGGLEVLELGLPAVVTADLRLNDPRYVTLPNIMKAKRKPLDILPAMELGVDPAPRLTLLKVEEPPPRPPGIMVADIDALIDALKNHAQVI